MLSAPSPLSLPVPRGKQTSYVVLREFLLGIDGGVDKTAIDLKATPMCRNVVFRDRGGFSVRPSVRPLSRGETGDPVGGLAFAPLWYGDFWRGSPGAGFSSWHLAVTNDETVWYADDTIAGSQGDGVWTDLGITRIGPITTEVFDNNLYLSLGNQESNSTTQRMARWDGGATADALGLTWSEDIENPTDGNMPAGRFVAWMNERMWVGNIATADGAGYRNRVHFSHLGRPESWRSEDWLPVGGPDEITGLCALRDMLVVFKRNSTWAVQGYGTDSFRVVQISGEIGCTGQWHRNTDFGVVWWDKHVGVCQFNGRGVENLFEPLLPFLSVDRAINECYGLAIVNGDVFVATDYTGYQADTVNSDLATWADVDNDTWDNLFHTQDRWRDLITYSGEIIWHLQASAGAGWTAHSVRPATPRPLTCIGVNRLDDAGRNRLVVGFDTPGSTGLTYLLNIVTGQSDGLDRTVPYWWDFSESGTTFNWGLDRWPGAILRNTDNGDIWQWSVADEWTQLGNEDNLALVGQLDAVRNQPIDAWYLTPWLHAGLPGQIKRFRAPRVVQEGDQVGGLLIDVYYDYGEENLRRELAVPVASAAGRYSYSVNKPGTVGRARAVQLRIRNDSATPRHWGVSQVAIPYHPKRMR